MSMKRLALIAAVSSYTSTSHTTTTTTIGSLDLNSNLVADTGGNVNSGSVAGGGGELYQGHQAMRPGATLHGNVNVLLGGAMLSVVITIVCVVCYCCHRNIKKRSESIYRQRWMENDANMEVYSVEQCYETAGLFAESPDTISTSINVQLPSHSGPPPSYDAVLAMEEFVGRSSPPPEYNQPGRKYRKNYTNIRHSSVAYPNHFNKLNSSGTGIYLSESCCSLGRQNEAELNGDDCKPTPLSEIDSFNNNNNRTNNNNETTPVRHYGCSLCGKSQRNLSLSIDSGFENIYTDIQNGNRNIGCSCHLSPDQVLMDQDNFMVSALRTDTMNNNHINGAASATYQHSSERQQQQISVADLDTFNENGIIRMDMSQIIDRTGLPTYEAAIKLESSGYV